MTKRILALLLCCCVALSLCGCANGNPTEPPVDHVSAAMESGYDKNGSEPTGNEIDGISLLVGTANWMTNDASMLANGKNLSMIDTPPEIFAIVESNSEISRKELVPVRAYYCDDMKPVLRHFADEMEVDLDEVASALSGYADYEDAVLMNLPILLAGRMVGSNYLAGMSFCSYSRLLHAKTNLYGVKSVILQYSSDDPDTSYENGLYSWTVFLPVKDEKISAVTYNVTSMFNMEWGQDLIKNWQTFDVDQIRDAVQLTKNFDYDAPSSKNNMDLQDYIKIAENTADILKNVDFARTANLYVMDPDVLELIGRYQTNLRGIKPRYEIYTGESVKVFIDEKVTEISAEIKEELDETDEEERAFLSEMTAEIYIALLTERYRIIWGSQVFNGSIGAYGTRVLASNGVMRSGADAAFKDKADGFPKPKNWDGPKTVILKYSNMSVALFFNECGNNYISINIFFIGDRNGFDAFIEEAGFRKVD